MATTAFLWIFQTRLAEQNAINLLRLNISDVREDIIDASDENLLKLTRQIASELNTADVITSELRDCISRGAAGSCLTESR